MLTQFYQTGHVPKVDFSLLLFVITLNSAKMKIVAFAYHVDPEEMAHYNEPTHLGLHCLSSSL